MTGGDWAAWASAVAAGCSLWVTLRQMTETKLAHQRQAREEQRKDIEATLILAKMNNDAVVNGLALAKDAGISKSEALLMLYRGFLDCDMGHDASTKRAHQWTQKY